MQIPQFVRQTASVLIAGKHRSHNRPRTLLEPSLLAMQTPQFIRQTASVLIAGKHRSHNRPRTLLEPSLLAKNVTRCT